MTKKSGMPDKIIIDALAGFLQPDGSKVGFWMNVNTVAYLATGNPSGQGLNAVHKTLLRLVKSGEIERREVGNNVYYKLPNVGMISGLGSNPGGLLDAASRIIRVPKLYPKTYVQSSIYLWPVGLWGSQQRSKGIKSFLRASTGNGGGGGTALRLS